MNQELEDQELIYLIKNESNKHAFFFLWKKYKKDIDKISKFNFNKFKYVPLEFSDLNYLIYKIFWKTIFIFNQNKGKTFYNFLNLNLKWNLIQYIKKFANRNFSKLNFSQEEDNEKYEIEFDDYETNKINELKLQLKTISKNFSEKEKKILDYKLDGYSWKKIEKITNLTYKQLDNTWQRIRKKCKLLNN
jgi:hypothetical protein